MNTWNVCNFHLGAQTEPDDLIKKQNLFTCLMSVHPDSSMPDDGLEYRHPPYTRHSLKAWCHSQSALLPHTYPEDFYIKRKTR